MTISRERCAICDCDRDGNVWPESAGMLCVRHQTIARMRAFVIAGALTDFGEDEHGYNVNHYSRMIGPAIADARAHTLAAREERTGEGMAGDIRRWVDLAAVLTPLGVEWAAPCVESPGDGMAVYSDVIVPWILDQMAYWLERRRGGNGGEGWTAA